MILIKNGKVHIGNGQILENHDVLIENNLIKKVAQNIEVGGVKLIDATGNEVFPGFIDPISYVGCGSDASETTDTITPNMNVRYAFNPVEMAIEKLYKSGVTAVGSTTGSSNIISGQIAVFRTYGTNPKKMLVREGVALRGSVSESVKSTYGERNVCPKTRMGIFNILDSTLREAKEAKIEECDEKKLILKKALNKEIKVFITANTKMEIDALIHVLDQYDIDLVIVNAYEAHKSINEIKKSNTSIIIGDQIEMSVGLYKGTDLKQIADLQKEGKLVSFTAATETYNTGKEEYLWNAIEIYKSGVASEDVIKMMTLDAAKLLNVDDILGSIEEGKEADIVIYTNDPVKYYNARAKYTIIGGEIVYSEGGVQ